MKVAFVAPFYGASATGGAEAECRKTAMKLHAAGVDVEIITTCLKDLQNNLSHNFWRAGTHVEDGITVHRFRVPPQDYSDFAALNSRILQGDQLSEEEQNIWAARHINSPDMLQYIADHQADYSWFCFIPYLFGTSIYGSRIIPEKSMLIPCLHDEHYARLTPIRDMFQRVAKCVYHVPSERELGLTLYGGQKAEEEDQRSEDRGRKTEGRTSGSGKNRNRQEIPNGPQSTVHKPPSTDYRPPTTALLIGEGIDIGQQANAGRFREKFCIQEKFLLYAGRKAAEKNVDQLLSYFADYCSSHPDSDLKLIMLGPGKLPVPPATSGRVIDLGFVDIQDKRDAYAATDLFCQPSLNESFSIVLMEAWDQKRPVLVHGDCAVTRDHVVDSGGGLYYRSSAEFCACVDKLLNDESLSATMGGCGQQYVHAKFSWERIVDRFINEVFV